MGGMRVRGGQRVIVGALVIGLAVFTFRMVDDGDITARHKVGNADLAPLTAMVVGAETREPTSPASVEVEVVAPDGPQWCRRWRADVTPGNPGEVIIDLTLRSMKLACEDGAIPETLVVRVAEPPEPWTGVVVRYDGESLTWPVPEPATP